jgi:Peptidase C10 family.
MKKILVVISLLAFFGSISVQAAPVSRERALDIAKKVLAAQPATKAIGDVKLIWDGEDVATKGAQPAIYVFGRERGGFVIVAGDDNVSPVLAISDHNEFNVEGMPENVKWWMERMKAYVRAATTQAPEVREQWLKYTGTKSGPFPDDEVTVIKDDYLTPEWGQGVVYHKDQSDQRQIFNSKCPKDGEGRYTITGCVATSIGEVMTTLSGIYPTLMPTHGEGTIESYSVSTGFISAVTPYTLGTVYDWANLRTLTNKQAIISALVDGNGAYIDNMDQLLADLGAVMRAYYSYNNTSAYTMRIPEYIATYFPGFNKAAYYAYASDYTAHQWREKLKGQLARRPIIYNGRTEDNQYGHAFVFDGYGTVSGNDVFHVNFGWNGNCNGYYYETNLDADGTPEYNYSWKCGAVFDFYPEPSSSFTKLETYADGTKPDVFPGVRAELDSESGKYYIYYSIINKGSKNYSGQIKFAVKKKSDGSINDIAGSVQDFTVSSSQGSGASIGLYQITGISFGDQVICLYKDGTEWKQLPGPAVSTINEWPLIPSAFIKKKAAYHQYDWFDFELMNNDYIYKGTTWTITEPDGTQVVKPQSDCEFQLTKTGQYKIQAATAMKVGGDVIEKIVTYINVE